jgi:hypothetical protein
MGRFTSNVTRSRGSFAPSVAICRCSFCAWQRGMPIGPYIETYRIQGPVQSIPWAHERMFCSQVRCQGSRRGQPARITCDLGVSDPHHNSLRRSALALKFVRPGANCQMIVSLFLNPNSWTACLRRPPPPQLWRPHRPKQTIRMRTGFTNGALWGWSAWYVQPSDLLNKPQTDSRLNSLHPHPFLT